MHLTAIHHVLVTMPPGGEDEAITFYCDLLGLEMIEKPEHLAKRGGCWFAVGDLQIHLGVDPHFRPVAKAHTAFLTDDLVGLRARLEGAGVGVVEDQPLQGYSRFYASDPFGNRLEFLAESENGRP